MKKKAIAVAVAGALAAPAIALAQASNVQIYGRANLGFDNYGATGGSAGYASGAGGDLKNRNRVFDNASRLGVRGTEDLGNGLRAFFQIESGANIDTGTNLGQNGAANASTGFLASRDSYVGIGGNWGDVRFGRQSIYWVNGVIAQTGPNYINTEVPWLSNNVGRVPGPTARTSNVMQYNSPTWSGFNFTVSYAPNSEATGVTVVPPPTPNNTDANIWGVTARYSGVINAQFDYAVNQAATPLLGGPRLKITGTKLGIGWPYAPGAQISLLYQGVNNDQVAGAAGFSAAGDNIKQNVWSLNWEQIFGNVQVMAIYGKQQKASGCSALQPDGSNGCDGTDATGYTLAAKYLLSKRTGVYVSWNKVTNGKNQCSDYLPAGITSAPAPAAVGTCGIAPGSDPRIWAVGIMHNF